MQHDRTSLLKAVCASFFYSQHKWLPKDQGRKEESVEWKASDGQSPHPEQGARNQAGPICPVFNRAELLRRVMNDRDLAREVLSVFLNTLPQRQADLQAHVADHNIQAAVMTAHTIKGAAVNAGFPAVAELARAMEMTGKDGDMETLATLLPELERRIVQCFAAVDDDISP